MLDFKTYSVVLVLVLGLFATLSWGCFGAEEEEAEAGPPLPPVSSMTMDISAFQSGKADGKADTTGPKANFNNAAVRVWWLNASIVTALTVPAATLAAALTVEPVFEDGKWIYDFNVTSGGHTYQALLEGWFDGGLKEGIDLNISMTVTCTACKTPLQDFVFYTGKFDTDGTNGYWQFFNPEITAEDKTFVKVDYEILDDTHRTLTFTNNRTDGDAKAGDIITYSIDGDTAHVSVHVEEEGLEYDAEWSISTTAGWLEIPDYNDGNRACWDASHLNVDCE